MAMVVNSHHSANHSIAVKDCLETSCKTLHHQLSSINWWAVTLSAIRDVFIDNQHVNVLFINLSTMANGPKQLYISDML